MDCAILGYACQSIWGDRTQNFWDALIVGKTPESYRWSRAENCADSLGDSLAGDSSLFLLTQKLMNSFRELRQNIELVSPERLGVILASTKGCIDDYIWNENTFQAHRFQDPVTPVLESFLNAAEISPKLSLCVSNACASSLSAAFLGQRWIQQGRVDQVLVLACDRVGPFVEKGFQSLQAVSASIPRPFSENRDGLRLGEAAGVLLLGRNEISEDSIVLKSVGLDTEGYAVTRPSPSGASLCRAYGRAYGRAYLASENKIKPDLIIAHGTGTQMNDQAEDEGFFSLFQDSVPVTGSKWAIGHTLGTSGMMDMIAAAQVLKTQSVFSLATTEHIDPKLKCHYLTKNLAKNLKKPIDTVMVSSLGFGGIHATVLLCRQKAQA